MRVQNLHSFIHSFTRACVRACMNACTIHSFIHSFIHSRTTAETDGHFTLPDRGLGLWRHSWLKSKPDLPLCHREQGLFPWRIHWWFDLRYQSDLYRNAPRWQNCRAWQTIDGVSGSLQTSWDIDTMPNWCWASVVDGGPTLIQHLVSCLLGLQKGWQVRAASLTHWPTTSTTGYTLDQRQSCCYSIGPAFRDSFGGGQYGTSIHFHQLHV